MKAEPIGEAAELRRLGFRPRSGRNETVSQHSDRTSPRNPTASSRGTGDRGQAVPLVIAAVALAAVGLVALGRLAAGTVDAARARTAADAAALAGAIDGRGAAAAAATENGATLVSFAVAGDEVTVEVQVGRAVAAARATLVLAPSPQRAVMKPPTQARPLRSPRAPRRDPSA
jgi:hypothetical protein